MFTLLILALALVAFLVVGSLLLGVGGFTLLVMFGDLIVAGVAIYFIVKLIIQK